MVKVMIRAYTFSLQIFRKWGEKFQTLKKCHCLRILISSFDWHVFIWSSRLMSFRRRISRKLWHVGNTLQSPSNWNCCMPFRFVNLNLTYLAYLNGLVQDHAHIIRKYFSCKLWPICCLSIFIRMMPLTLMFPANFPRLEWHYRGVVLVIDVICYIRSVRTCGISLGMIFS